MTERYIWSLSLPGYHLFSTVFLASLEDAKTSMQASIASFSD
jgi:hypothetical protein